MIKNKSFIVSCQALKEEPLYSSFIMSKMALAAYQGGADAIRCNGKEDIRVIKKEVNIPIIGIVKAEYEDSDVYITPTMKEIEELILEEVDIIALDATNRIRPNHLSLEVIFGKIKKNIQPKD